MVALAKVDMLIFIIGYMVFSTNGNTGLVEIIANIGNLSGKLCHKNVTFICNAEFNSQFIGWYSDDTVLGSYTWNNNDNFPLTISSTFTIEIKLLSAFAITNTSEFSFQNFTFSADLYYLYQFQGSDITCGSFFKRSNSIYIGNYTVVDETDSLSVMYTAIYNSTAGNLIQILVQWNILNVSYLCNIMYKVEMKKPDNILVFNNTLTSQDCIDNVCLQNITTPADNVEAYNVYVSASSMNTITDVNSVTIVTSAGILFGSNLEMKDCRSTFKCSVINNESCLLQYGSDPNFEKFLGNHTFESNTTYNFTFNFISQKDYFVQLSKVVNSAYKIQRLYFQIGSSTNMDVAYIVTGFIVFGIGSIILFLGCSICFFSLRARKYNGKVFYLLCFFLAVTIVIFLLSLALWISYYTSKRDFCGLHLRNSSLALSAMVFSFLLSISTCIVCGGFCLLNIPKAVVEVLTSKPQSNSDSNREQEKEELENVTEKNVEFNFTFGMETSSDGKNETCANCDHSLSVIFYNKCGACGKRLCKACKNDIAYVPVEKSQLPVCSVCFKVYWEENIDIYRKDFLELVLVLHNSHSELYKPMWTDYMGSGEKECPKCKKIAHEAYFKEVDFGNKENVCEICYMLLIRLYHLVQRFKKVTGKDLTKSEEDSADIELTPEILMTASKEVSLNANKEISDLSQPKEMTDDQASTML